MRNARYGILPGAPRGANPMAPPLQDPAQPIVPGQSIYTSSSDLSDGSPKLLARYQFESPTPCVVNVCAPLQGFKNPVLPFIQADSTLAGDDQLWILGKCTVGNGGTSFSYEFDIPAAQMTQLSHVATYLEVSARLIRVPVAIANDFIGEWLFPPTFQGKALTPIRVVAQGGPGYTGLTNATRRCRMHGVTNIAPGTCPIPPFANRVSVLAKSDVILDWVVLESLAPVSFDFGPLTYNSCCDYQVPEGAARLQVKSAGGAIDAELCWRLGFSGVEA